MTDINEKETMEFFINGAKKASSAALQLGFNQLVVAFDKLRRDAQKLATGRAQTRMQTLAMAARVEADALADEEKAKAASQNTQSATLTH